MPHVVELVVRTRPETQIVAPVVLSVAIQMTRFHPRLASTVERLKDQGVDVSCVAPLWPGSAQKNPQITCWQRTRLKYTRRTAIPASHLSFAADFITREALDGTPLRFGLHCVTLWSSALLNILGQ